MRFKEDSLKMIMWSKHSRRSEPMKRSAHGSAMAIALLSEFREFLFRSLADGMLLRKYNHDHCNR
jgi:hypothetical protein